MATESKSLRLSRTERKGRSQRQRFLSRYLSLILYKSYADLRSESQRTYVGYLWWVVDPVLSMAVYYLVFDILFSRGIENYALFLFVALIPWRWFQTTLMTGANSILYARGLMLQVYLPKMVFPLVTFLTTSTKFFIVFFLLVFTLPWFGFPFGMEHLALIPLLLINSLLIIGCSSIAAAFTPFFPDLRMVLENTVRLLFFLSGVLYPVEMMPEKLQAVLWLNPLTSIIESYRAIMIDGQWPEFGKLGAVALVSCILIAIGTAIIRDRDYAYPRIS